MSDQKPDQASEAALWDFAIEVTDAVETHRAKSVVTRLLREAIDQHCARQTERLREALESIELVTRPFDEKVITTMCRQLDRAHVLAEAALAGKEPSRG